MSRTAYKFSAVIALLLLTAMLAACGSDHREANANPASVARVDEATCRTCHAATLDPVSITPLMPEFLASAHNPDPSNPNAGVNRDPVNKPTGCQGCHGGGAEHNGVGPIPFPDPLAATPDGSPDRCVLCHTNPPAPTVARDFSNICAPCHTDTALGKQGIHAARSIDSLGFGDDCVHCHAIPIPQHGNLVGDNQVTAGTPAQTITGIRTVVQEFSKWSHHVTGVTLSNAHCAACHLEGTVGVSGNIVRDDNFHMTDARIHLRNADTDADMPWDPANPTHSTIDNFCMSCHDADGATSATSAKIQTFINSSQLAAPGKTASPRNPFGDTISNRYDKMQRPGVVDAKSQFATTNNSHHGVRGPRYSGRTRLAGARQIASPSTFANNSTPLLQGARSTIYDAGNFNQLYVPLGDTGGETAPRTGSATLGDDSTLHCGDCHTVGQWKPGSSTNAAGLPTPAAIGAHGSNNEYLLRNSIGTDQRHTQNAFLLGNAAGTVFFPGTTNPIPNGVVVPTNPNGAFLVCYNCHAFSKYGSVFLGTGLVGGHAGEYDGGGAATGDAGRCNGIGNTLPFNGYTTGKATDGTQFFPRLGLVGFPGAPVTNSVAVFAGTPAFAPGFPLIGSPPVGEQDADFGDIFGIQCLNCHNSGYGNAYGGIHGSANNTPWNNGTTLVQPAATIAGGAYIDGMGNTVKVERFLPGLGDAMHVPGTLGGFTGGVTAGPVTNSTFTYTYTTGGISNDTNWEQKYWLQTATTVINTTTNTVSGTTARAGAGCYTLGLTQSTGAAIVTTDVTSGISGPSVTGIGGPATNALGTWGGCNDHVAGQGKGNHGFLKRIVRPVTY